MSNTLRVSFMNEYPYINKNCSKSVHWRVGTTCLMPGLTVELLSLIADYLNLNIEVVKVIPRVPAWKNVFNEVYRNETDVYGLLFGEHTPNYAEKFEFTNPIYWNNVKAVVRRPDDSFKSIFNFFEMYSVDSWMCVIGVFILFTIFGSLVHYVECRLKLRERYKIAEVFWAMTGMQLSQSSNQISYKLVAGKLSLLIFSIFQLLIILGLYESLILTEIIKKAELTPFPGNDFANLIARKRLTLVLDRKEMDWIVEEINHNLESPFYELRKAVEYNPYIVVDDVLKTLNREHNAVTLFVENNWYHTQADSNCNLILVDVMIRQQPQRFMFKKGSRFVSLFNEAIHVNRYLIELIVRKYLTYRSISKCPSHKGITPLSLTPYLGLLTLFVIGIGVACFVFTGELMQKNNLRKRF
ncbi:hypothetical protein M3Y95_00410000 [Aphelenchoides besseyi]|nr:hypothetical protein M3Y95_00410000 [Aphelenchoides besseyi]